jgi:hypothetical protein
MFLEIALFAVLCIFVGALITKVYEWYQNVLHGPYIGRHSERNRKAGGS